MIVLPVRVDDAWRRRAPARARGADRRDAVAVDDDGAVVDHLVALHRDDARADEGDACRWARRRARPEADVASPAAVAALGSSLARPVRGT